MAVQQIFIASRKISPVDIALALIAAALFAYSALFVDSKADLAGNEIVSLYTVVTIACIATGFRRTKPLLSASLVYFSFLARFLLLPTLVIPFDVVILFSLFAITVYGERKARIAALLGALFYGFLLTFPVVAATPSLESMLYFLLVESVVIATFSLALLRYLQLQRYQEMLNRNAEILRESERESEMAVIEERTRIAREMHDIVAHTLSVVIAQADGGRYAAEANPQAAQRALETIAEMSRAALGDIRSIIGVLRDPNESHSPLKPQPVGDDLEQLVQNVRESGADISYLRLGKAFPLPVGLGNALYRICQEALTNSLKHAGPHAKITVVLKWTRVAITLEILDDGRGAAAPDDGKGHGVIGMRERAAVFGGTVDAGPRPEGGFKVRALIPVTTSRGITND
ncbi:signal transduction histidine kinase [Arcanobacterium pluranimalium]|uniref:sensor histidine kinase n=1 Tax=Arcanobacterium pluranimalium TaxID=108028 RepID=UPI00195D0F3E|nr:sensor histidine kinase [Arcanobacterium pluranimalium]MBM7825765.1 signal transduction histidine kinase [Arcanobacterium pluranimalium]